MFKRMRTRREFVRAYSIAVESNQPQMRFEAATRALELIAQLNPWPMRRPTRDSAIGTMHGVRGRYWGELHEAGDIEAGEKGIVEYEIATRHLSADYGPAGVVLELNYAVALDTLRTGDRAANRARAENVLVGLLARFRPEQDLGVWAGIRLNLIGMYGESDWPDAAERVERGIELAEEIIERTAPKTAPVPWARGKIGLAMLLLERAQGIHPKNIEDALSHLADVKGVVPRDDPQDYPHLLEMISRAHMVQSEGRDQQQLDRALKANAEAIAAYERVGQSVRWAALSVQRALLLSRLTGERHTQSKDEARSYLERALTVYTPEAFPNEFVNASGLLSEFQGVVQETNVESTGDVFLDSARLRLAREDRDRDPYSWQESQRQLARAILKPRGSLSSEEADEAIERLELALSVLDPERHAFDWVDAMQQLSDAYALHPRGDRRHNVTRAIEIQEQVLARIEPASNPALWAESAKRQAQNYSESQSGLRADNVEFAIAYVELAIAAIDDEQHAQLVSQLLENLGAFFGDRIRGEPERNARRSLDLLLQSASGHDRARDPVGWLRVQNKINDARRKVHRFEDDSDPASGANRPVERVEAARVSRTEDGESYVAELERASQAIEPESHFRTWALSRVALADALSLVAPSDSNGAELLTKTLPQIDEAIEICRDVASRPESDRDRYVRSIAQSRVGVLARLGALLADGAHRFFDIPAEQVHLDERRQLVVSECERGLDAARTIGSRSVLTSATGLGEAYFADRRWSDALGAFGEALEASAELIGDPEMSDEEARSTLEEVGKIASKAPWAAISAGDPSAAIRWAVQTRSRLLAKALSRGELVPGEELSNEVTTLRTRIFDLEHRIAGPELMHRLPVLEELIECRKRLAQLLKIRRADQRNEDDSDVQEWLKRVVGADGWLAVLVLTSSGGKWVVAGPDGSGVRVTTHYTNDEMSFTELFSGIGTAQAESWTAAYRGWSRRASGVMAIKWRDFIEEACPALYERYTRGLVEAADEHGIPHGATMRVIPHSTLAMLPLGASGRAGTSESVLDRMSISIVPTVLKLARSAKSKMRESQPLSAGVVFAPSEGPGHVAVRGAELEAGLVASAFDADASVIIASDSLDKESAIRALRGKDVWHFATHGVHDPIDQMQSGLVFSNDVRLTLRDLFMRYDLGRPRLVVLSACESGLHVDGGLPAEIVGLPSSFLMLGAEAVIASLWPVTDLSTALLMGKLYEEYPGRTPSSSIALRRAQQWLRDANADDLFDSVENWLAEDRLTSGQHSWLTERLSAYRMKHPFRSADYWGCWVHYGGG